MKISFLSFFSLDMQLTLSQYLDWVASWNLNPQDVYSQYLKNAQKLNPNINALVRFFKQEEKADFSSLSQLPLAWLPIVIKDNILFKDQVSSCGSHMLENFKAPYTATCLQNLLDAGVTPLGSANMDEFAMGGSNETSAFWPVKNPHGIDRIPGGSSWGSAVAVAADMAIAALGTDTGGSVRQPAAMCGIVGFKPTYWAVSRYGVVAMASSLDQVGIFSKTAEDAQILFSFLASHDQKDATSSPKADEVKKIQKPESKSRKFFVPQEALDQGLDPQIKSLFLKKIDQLRALGHTVDINSLPMLKNSLAIYYTLMPSEVSTNLSRFDGIRFGQQGNTHDFPNLDEYYSAMRSQGFWDEVKRRILLWTYILSSANYKSYYLKALEAQKQLKADFAELFSQYDAILTPTSPEAARKLGEKSDNPLKAYLADLYTVPANLAGVPAISVPMGFITDGDEQLPTGIQIMGPMRSDQSILNIAQLIEKL